MTEKSSENYSETQYPWQKSYPSDIDWAESYKGKPHFEILDQAVSRYGNDICSYFLGKELTYSEIGLKANQVAEGLQALGLKKGDKVGLFLPNCPTYIYFFFGILKAGGIVVNYNPLYSIDELEFQVKNSETKYMVTLDLKVLFEKCDALMVNGVLKNTIVATFSELLPTTKSILFRLFKSKELAKISASKAAGQCIAEKTILNNNGTPKPVEINPDTDIAVLQYTGGTTGRPKGAMLSHSNIYINTLQEVKWADKMYGGEKTVIGILPFFHVFAMTCVLNFSVATGSRMVLLPKFEINDAIKLMIKTRPTCMPGVPTLYNAFLNYKNLPIEAVENLQFCISGGAPLPQEIKQGFEKLSGCEMIEGYGLTETSPILTANLPNNPSIVGSIGIPFPQTVLSIRDLDDPTKEMPLGEKGEICASGPQVMLGYWNAPEATEKVFVGKFFRTGDVGYMDDKGFTYIVDRVKDLIICSGYNVYPRRIEDAIYQNEAVEEVTVLGIPDEYRGEAPKAFIKLKAGKKLTAEEMMAFLEPKLSKIEMPEEIEFRDELPKTMVGKLSKKELREQEG